MHISKSISFNLFIDLIYTKNALDDNLLHTNQCKLKQKKFSILVYMYHKVLLTKNL